MNIPNLDEIDEQLNAYLDGELSSAESSQLEQRLVTDERLRLRLAEMRRASELLNELPETPHNQQFTKSTLELVVKDLRSTIELSPTTIGIPRMRTYSWTQWPGIGLLMGTMLLLGALCGLGIQWLRSQRDLREIGLVTCLPGLLDLKDPNVVKELSKESVSLELLKKQLSERLFPPIPSSMIERSSWVNGLSAIQFAKLDVGREMIRKLPNDTYTRMDAIQQQLEKQPEAQSWIDTCQIVGLVLDELPHPRRLDMESMTNEQRIKFVKEQLALKAAVYYAEQMVEQDVRALQEWSQETLLPAFLVTLPNRGRRSNPDIKDLLNAWWYFRPYEMLDNQQELIGELAPELSDTARKLIQEVNRSDQMIVISAWLDPRHVSPTEKLLDTYEKINARDREAIDLQDPMQSKQVLEGNMRRSMQRGGR